MRGQLMASTEHKPTEETNSLVGDQVVEGTPTKLKEFSQPTIKYMLEVFIIF
jgi:hypothetical protein